MQRLPRAQLVVGHQERPVAGVGQCAQYHKALEATPDDEYVDQHVAETYSRAVRADGYRNWHLPQEVRLPPRLREVAGGNRVGQPGCPDSSRSARVPGRRLPRDQRPVVPDRRDTAMSSSGATSTAAAIPRPTSPTRSDSGPNEVCRRWSWWTPLTATIRRPPASDRRRARPGGPGPNQRGGDPRRDGRERSRLGKAGPDRRHPDSLKYGRSVTDACGDPGTTEVMLAEAVRVRRPACSLAHRRWDRIVASTWSRTALPGLAAPSRPQWC